MKAAIGSTIAGAHASSEASDALVYVPDKGPNVVDVYSAAHPERGPFLRRVAKHGFSPMNQR